MFGSCLRTLAVILFQTLFLKSFIYIYIYIFFLEGDTGKKMVVEAGERGVRVKETVAT